MWDEIKTIIKIILLFVTPYFILLLIIANPESTYVIIISVILLGVLLSTLKKIIFNITLGIRDYIRHIQDSKRRETTINEEKIIHIETRDKIIIPVPYNARTGDLTIEGEIIAKYYSRYTGRIQCLYATFIY